MGLMDMLGGASEGKGGMLDSVMNMVKDHPGGLGGIVDQLKAAGLTEQVNSWVGSGSNMPVTAEQIKAALGHSKLGELARQAGISPDDAANAVAQHLPHLVDKLTPNGTIPHGDLQEQAMAVLKTKFFGG